MDPRNRIPSSMIRFISRQRFTQNALIKWKLVGLFLSLFHISIEIQEAVMKRKKQQEIKKRMIRQDPQQFRNKQRTKNGEKLANQH